MLRREPKPNLLHCPFYLRFGLLRGFHGLPHTHISVCGIDTVGILVEKVLILGDIGLFPTWEKRDWDQIGPGFGLGGVDADR